MTETVRGGSSVPEEAKKRTSSSTGSARERLVIAELVKASRERGDDITGPEGLFEPVVAKKRQRRLSDVDAVAISQGAPPCTTCLGETPRA